MTGKGCNLKEPHDCATVRAANSALRSHLNRAVEKNERLASMVRGLIAEIRRRDGEGNTIPDHLYRALEAEVQP